MSELHIPMSLVNANYLREQRTDPVHLLRAIVAERDDLRGSLNAARAEIDVLHAILRDIRRHALGDDTITLGWRSVELAVRDEFERLRAAASESYQEGYRDAKEQE